MTDRDKFAFTAYLTGLGEIFDVQLSQSRIDLYFAALRDMSLETIKARCNFVGRTGLFFPKPIEIRNALQISAQDQALLAFDSVIAAIECHGYYVSVEFQDGVIGPVITALGGWGKVVDWETKDREWHRKEFVRLYVIYAARGPWPPAQFTGFIEHQNRLNCVGEIPKRVVIPAVPVLEAPPAITGTCM